ncbi:MAG: ATP-dependent DNA helicase [Caloramator sp.]|nr:ATP-dependent DNA helicase [Caloramator sp.]
MEKLIKISVRELVEFILRSGDIEAGLLATVDRAQEGARIHRMIQKNYGKNDQAEVCVKHLVKKEKYGIEISGRIDGLRHGEIYTLEEIKTTTKKIEDIELNFMHLAQARCYAYMFMLERNLDRIKVKVIYINIDSLENRAFEYDYQINELKEFFDGIVEGYVKFLDKSLEHDNKRNESIKEIKFPYPSFRESQRKLAVAVYKTIIEGKKLFLEAPTGTGKTMGTLFPAIKTFLGPTSKIFYLTAKTVGKTSAEDAIKLLQNNGLIIKSITLTSKEKICPNGLKCSPLECQFAKGHYDRINDALLDSLSINFFDREMIEDLSRKYNVCPFEFSLDLSMFCDIVICDYNYVFDITSSLKRYSFESKNDYVYLIDEAHNLVDRARDMYSITLSYNEFINVKKKFKSYRKLNLALGRVTKYFNGIRESFENRVVSKIDDEFLKAINKCEEVIEEFVLKNLIKDEELLNLYFDIKKFKKIAELHDENYRTLLLNEEDILIKLLCINPSKTLKEIMDKAQAAILFSATFTPLNYYMDLLGGDGSYKIKLSSPFSRENICVMLNPYISTRFNDRENTYEKVAKGIKSLTYKKGNYLVFFPSYFYLNEVLKRFPKDDVDLIVQRSDMTEEEKEDFLKKFSEDSEKTLIAFAVLGGIFGEGIDLPGDKLIGVCIVGVGLPQINFERDVFKEYFDEMLGKGFEYAYIYPGFNKVMQAVGRLIRTENDRGVVLLFDDRFLKRPYNNLIPGLWKPLKIVKGNEDIINELKNFWKEE